MTLPAAETLDVSVLVPAKDEAANLPEFLRLCAEAMGPAGFTFEVVVVNDGSRDDSGRVLGELERTYPFLRVVTHRRQRGIADALLRATGSVEWVDDENLMDAVTAVSGSGPAYIFLLAEELARAGVEAGLPQDLATRLARETVAGSGELLRRSDAPSAMLRQNVTSPGGTTAAALEVLMGPDGMQSLLTRAVAAATRRSKELAK